MRQQEKTASPSASKVIKSDGSGDAGPPPRRGVMAAEEVEARGVARQIVTDAEARAKAILAEAEQQKQQLLAEGRREGREEGLASVTAELARARLQAGAMLKAAEKDVLALALIVAEKILGRDLERDPQALVELCATAIENVRAAKQLVLRVHPESAAVLRTRLQALLERVGRPVELAIKEDPEVEKAGCIVQTEFGTVDAQLSTQLAMLERALVDPA